jgi:hypothetical protein
VAVWVVTVNERVSVSVVLVILVVV